MTDSQRVIQGCPVIDGAIGGSANAGHHVLYSVPLPRNPINQPIIYEDLRGPVTTNFGSQGCVPNLFSLPAPVYAGTVLAGAPYTVPTAAALARSAPAARVNKRGTETALRDRRLASYEARFKQEELVSPVSTAVVSASVPCSAEHGQMVHPGSGGTSNPLQVGEAVSPWTRHQEHAHLLAQSSRLQVAIIWAKAFHVLVHGLSLAMMKPQIMTIISLVSMVSLTRAHMNLIWLTQT